MKKEQRPAYAVNLRKARKALGWNREKASVMLGIPPSTFGSYEEGRAKPGIDLLPKFAHVLGIANILSFLENYAFDYHQQDKGFTISVQSDLENIYANAPARDREVVDMLLGIGVKKVTC